MAATARADTTGSPSAGREEIAARTLRADLEKLRESGAALTAEVEQVLQAAVEAYPLVAAAGAAGLGFLLGGGLSRGALALFARTGTGLAATWLSEEILQRVRAQRADSAAEEPR